MRKPFYRISLLILLAVSLISCGDDDEPKRSIALYSMSAARDKEHSGHMFFSFNCTLFNDSYKGLNPSDLTYWLQDVYINAIYYEEEINIDGLPILILPEGQATLSVTRISLPIPKGQLRLTLYASYGYPICDLDFPKILFNSKGTFAWQR